MTDHTHPPADVSMLAIRVKPLAWHPKHGCDAIGLGIKYCMSETTPGLFGLYSPFHTKDDMPKSEIQAAAQADYDARITAAIEPAPDPRDAVIAQLVGAAEEMAAGVIVECDFDGDHSPDFGRRYVELRAALAAAKAVME